MRKFLMTTALVLPLGVGAAFAQETDEAETELEQGAEQAGEAVEDAAEEAGEALEEGAEAAEEGAEDAGEAVEETAEEGAEEVEEEADEAESEMEEEADEAESEMEEEADEAESEMEAETEESEAEMEAGAEETAEADDGETIVREQTANELRVDWITGTTVLAEDGSTIGDINDLIVDGETGEMQAAIVGVGGFLGIGEKQIAVAWDELQINYDANEITSSITREEADEAPEYVFRDQEDAPAATGTEPAAGTDTGTMGTEPAPAD